MGINIFIDRAFADIGVMVRTIQRKYEIVNLYIPQEYLGNDLILKEDEFSSIHIYRYDFIKLERAEYEEYRFSKEAPPVDDAILQALSPYAAEIIKMMERGGYEAESYEERIAAYTIHVRYWNYMLEATKIDFVLFTGAPHTVHDYIIFRLSQMKGIKFGMLEVLPIQHKMLVMPMKSYEDWDDSVAKKIAEYSNRNNIVLPEEYEDEFRKLTEPELHVVPYIVRSSLIQRIHHMEELFRYYGKQNMRHAVKKTIVHFRKRFQLDKVLKIYEKLAVDPNYDCKYIYFPLHYQPEKTTSPLGRWFVNQYLAIEMLSFYAPPDVYIYVKEHPAYKTHPVSTRNKELYLRIKKLDNVRLISMSADTISLINHCSAVSSITGSVGYEALFKEKPYIMFGYQVMRYAPGTINVRNNEDCKMAMKKIFEENFKPTLREARGFMKALSEIGMEREEIDRIVESLIPNLN